MHRSSASASPDTIPVLRNTVSIPVSSTCRGQSYRFHSFSSVGMPCTYASEMQMTRMIVFRSSGKRSSMHTLVMGMLSLLVPLVSRSSTCFRDLARGRVHAAGVSDPAAALPMMRRWGCAAELAPRG